MFGVGSWVFSSLGNLWFLESQLGLSDITEVSVHNCSVVFFNMSGSASLWGLQSKYCRTVLVNTVPNAKEMISLRKMAS